MTTRDFDRVFYRRNGAGDGLQRDRVEHMKAADEIATEEDVALLRGVHLRFHDSHSVRGFARKICRDLYCTSAGTRTSNCTGDAARVVRQVVETMSGSDNREHRHSCAER